MTLREALIGIPNDAVINFMPKDLKIPPYEGLSPAECHSRCAEHLDEDVDWMVDDNEYYIEATYSGVIYGDLPEDDEE